MTWLRVWLHCAYYGILTATLAQGFIISPNPTNLLAHRLRACPSNPSPSSIDSVDTCPLPLDRWHTMYLQLRHTLRSNPASWREEQHHFQKMC